MGFFSLKVTCSVCGEECGLHRFQIRDGGWVCNKCFKEAGLTLSSPVMSMTAGEIREIINRKNQGANELATLQITKQIGPWLKVDENSRKWFIPDGFGGIAKNPIIHSYDDILDFELLEDGGSIVKGGLGRALVGGYLFGGVGAIVGGVTGKKSGKSTCTSLKIKITLNDMIYPTEYIDLITTETQKNSQKYQTCIKQAHDIISLFQVMCESNKTQQKTEAKNASELSSADEILKFKNLLDSGIISQEEFDAKKKQLLGL